MNKLVFEADSLIFFMKYPSNLSCLVAAKLDILGPAILPPSDILEFGVRCKLASLGPSVAEVGKGWASRSAFALYLPFSDLP